MLLCTVSGIWAGFPSVANVMAILIGLVILVATFMVYRLKIHIARMEGRIAKLKLDCVKREAQITKLKLDAMEKETVITQLKLDGMKKEQEFTTEAFKKTQRAAEKIAENISDRLIENPKWLDRFMDETGATYGASVYGKRIRHFVYEKRELAKLVMQDLQERLHSNPRMHYCLLIDSGTTLFPLFHEIAVRLRDTKMKRAWVERVHIVTNNLPGVQYLSKNGKADPSDMYSEIAMKCFLVPGKPLSVYSAVIGEQTVKWLQDSLKAFLETDWKLTAGQYKVLGFITGNYIARRECNDGRYYDPVARGEGHPEFKRALVDQSDEVIIISPLMKFSFANAATLNSVLELTIDPSAYPNDAHEHPKQVRYQPIHIPKHKCTFYTTGRTPGSKFHMFGTTLEIELRKAYDPSRVRVASDFDLSTYLPGPDRELEWEIPHENLLDAYRQGIDIWDWACVQNYVSRWSVGQDRDPC